MPFYVAFTLITGDDDIVNMAFHLALQYNFRGILGEHFSKSLSDDGDDEGKI